MSLLEQGSMVDLAVAVKKSKLEAMIRKKKMGFSGFLILFSRVLRLSVSLTRNCSPYNGRGSDKPTIGLEISSLIKGESFFFISGFLLLLEEREKVKKS